MRYHRARGYFCGTGGCTHCFVRHDGVPNVRACETPCRADAWVQDQNSLPSARFDVLAATDLAFPDYLDAHRAFIRPRFLKPLFNRVIRGMAGFGRIPREPVPQTYHHERIDVDVCVVGAGPAGIAAATSAAQEGRKVLLLERRPRVGGRFRCLPSPFHATGPDAPREEGRVLAESGQATLEELGVDVRTEATLFGIYPGLRLAAGLPTRLLEIDAKRTVLAPGALDTYRPFAGSDRAGVLLATGAFRLLNEYGVLPGQDVVIVGATRDGCLLARDLVACGARVRAIVDAGPAPAKPTPLHDDVRRLGIEIRWRHIPVRVLGRAAPRGLVVHTGTRQRIPCDSVVLATGRHPAVELFQQAGCRIDYHPSRGGFHPVVDEDMTTSVAHVLAAGGAAGAPDPWQSVLEGRVAGLAAASSLSADAKREPLAEAKARLRAHRERSLEVAA